MSSWQKVGAVISILWVIGFLIFLIVHSGSLKTVADVLIAVNYNSFILWFMILGPVVFLWAIGVITFDAVQWIGYHPLRTAGMTDCVCASRAAPPDIPSRQA
jgi:hypothetical protein